MDANEPESWLTKHFPEPLGQWDLLRNASGGVPTSPQSNGRDGASALPLLDVEPESGGGMFGLLKGAGSRRRLFKLHCRTIGVDR